MVDSGCAGGRQHGHVGGDRGRIERRLDEAGHAALRVEHRHRGAVVDRVLVDRRAFLGRRLGEHQTQ
jgi:hypothetical protein